MSVQFDLMLAFCCNDHTEIPDAWYGKASPQICFTRRLAKILRNFVPPVTTSVQLGSEFQLIQASCSAAV
jgi:hypothetical protein